MKRPIKLTFAVATLALALGVPASQAAEDSAPSPDSSHERASSHRHGGERGERLKKLAEKLELTAEQKEKIRPILVEEARALKAVRDDDALTKEARREKARDIRETHRAQIRSLLTPEQQAKFDAMKDGKHKGRAKADKDDAD